MMSLHTRVRTSDLSENRLAAEYYSDKFVLNEIKIRKFGAIETLESIRKDNVPIRRGIDMPEFVEDSSSPLMITIASFDDPGIEFRGLKRVSIRQHEAFKGSHVTDGDLLVAMGGYAGKAAICPAETPKANIGRHTARVAIDQNKADRYYIWSFIRSVIGTLQFEREITGSVQAGINLEDIRNIQIPCPSLYVQKYIGDKVRQAERLRAWSKQLLSMSDARISANFKYSLVDSMTEHPRWMPSKLVSEISLGPEFARGTEGQQTFKNAVSFVDVIDSCKCGDPIKSEERVAGRFPYYGASGPIDFHDEYNFDGTYLIIAQDGSIGCASVARGKIWANNHVWIVKINGQYDVDTIARYLDVHFPYWKGITTGSVVPKVTAENLLRLKVPLDVAKDNLAGELLRTSGCATVAAKALTVVARLLVEALIEGKLTEQQLIDTQKALESDDNSLDRDILGRLTTKGLDGEGDPLFADLDQLYGLLAQCQPTDE